MMGMYKSACGVHKLSWALLIIGGLNWLLVGLLQKDLFVLLGMTMSDTIPRIVYVLVGLSAISMLSIGMCCMKGGMKDCANCGPKSTMPSSTTPPMQH